MVCEEFLFKKYISFCLDPVVCMLLETVHLFSNYIFLLTLSAQEQ